MKNSGLFLNMAKGFLFVFSAFNATAVGFMCLVKLQEC